MVVCVFLPRGCYMIQADTAVKTCCQPLKAETGRQSMMINVVYLGTRPYRKKTGPYSIALSSGNLRNKSRRHVQAARNSQGALILQVLTYTPHHDRLLAPICILGTAFAPAGSLAVLVQGITVAVLLKICMARPKGQN